MQIKKLWPLIVVIGLVFGITLFASKNIEVSKLIEAGGIFAIAATIFAETGLLVGFFLPGDTLLFAAGFFAAQGQLNIVTTIVAIVIAAFFGNMAGYEIGRRNGKKIFSKENSVFFHKKYIESADRFYTEHGGKTILLARFVPVVRTLAPLMAGAAKMDYKRFLGYNLAGAILWGTSVTLIGYWAGKILGQYFDIDKYLLPIILLATLGTFGASFIHALREPETRRALTAKFRRNYKTFFKN